MKTPLLPLALLLAALPTALPAAPGTVHDLVEKIAHGNGVTLADGDYFGNSCTVVGDLDGDGIPELAVGAYLSDAGGNFQVGAVHLLFLNSDGTVRSTTKIPGGSGAITLMDDDFFGASCAAVGDLDGDGVQDLAVGAYRDDTNGEDRGAVHVIFLNSNGTVKSAAKIADGSGGLSLANSDFFGISCSAVGDLDGDGVTELAVGAAGDDTGGDKRGAVHLIYLNADGTVKSFAKIADGSGGLSLLDAGQFGYSCTALGDLDGDGVPELAVGAFADNTGGPSRGAVYLLFPNADGSVKTSVKIADGSGGLSLGDGNSFGGSCTSPGDLDGDGVPEIAVGAVGDSTVGSFRGAVHLIFLNPNGTVKSLAKISHGSGGIALADFDLFGHSCATLGDLDGDGIIEFVVGAISDSDVGFDRGAVFLLELGDPPLTVTTLVDKLDAFPSSPLSLREAIRDADATGEFRTIRFDPALDGQEVEVLGGANGPLQIETQSLRITGEGLPGGLTVLGDLDRIFMLTNATLTVDRLNLRGGDFSGGGGAFLVDAGSRLVLDRVTIADCRGHSGGGGAIRCEGSVAITSSTFLDNTADHAGAIVVSGATADLTVLNSTFTRNTATSVGSGGGAIQNANGAASSIRYATFVGNSTQENGGAILNDSGTVVVGESLFSGNTAAASPDFDGATTNAGGNASVALSQLMTFGDYGGPTPVQPLKPTSAAKNTAFHRALPATDQRGAGFPRTVGTGRDPGAVEGTELSDFQPDNRIGLSLGRQIGNNRYNTNGAGQTIALKLSGKRKAKTFFTVENDGLYLDSIRMKSDAPSRRSLNGKVFSLTGGRRNVSAQVFRTGLLLSDVVPSGSAAFQGEWSRKSLKVKPKQTAKLTSTSMTAPKSDVAGTRVSGK